MQTLVNAVQGNDYITSIVPIVAGEDTIGYTITFTKSGPVTIYNGKDGKDGNDGADGLPGADGKDGADGSDGADGVDGTDGLPGVDGNDGVTPQLKIEEGYWYISYDDGATWKQLGKATGEDGNDGMDGVDGDSMFESVTQDDSNVY